MKRVSRLSRLRLARTARSVLVGLLLVTWSGAGAFLHAQAVAPKPMTPAEAAVVFRPYADKLGRLFQASEAADRDLPHEEFDVAALAKKLGADPAAAMGWVRDHTYWVPYMGALRGPTGVLLDRVGDSLDRAMLLASILKANGNESRIARARLSADQAGKLLTAVRPFPADHVPGRIASDQQAMNTLVEKYGKPFQLDTAELKKNAETGILAYQRGAEELAQRVADQMPALREIVGKPQGDPAADLQSWTSQCLQDHAWVQVLSQGKWIDLDPLLPDAKPGTPPIAAPSEMWPITKSVTDAVKADQWNEVELRVVVERADAKGITRSTVLKQVLRPAVLFGQRIALSNINVGAADVNPFTDPDPNAALRNAAMSQHEWAPVLQVGEQQIIQGSFLDTGKVNPKADLDAMARMGKTISGGLGGALSALGGDEPPPKEGSTGELVSETIEFEVHAPGRPVSMLRREVFDLLGPAGHGPAAVLSAPLNEDQKLNRGLALEGQVEILIEAAEFNAPSLEHLTNQAFLSNRGVILNALHDGSLVDKTALPQFLSKLVPGPGPLYGLAVARHQASPAAADTFIDRPNILTYRRTITNAPGGTLDTVEGFDIVSNAIGVRPGAKDPFGTRMLQGVVDTNAEAVLMNATAAPADQVQSTANTFAQARIADQTWTLVKDTAAATASGSKWTPDTKARVAEELAGGCVNVMPAAPTPVAGRPSMTWWRIDPRTGETLGVDDRGHGTSMVEYGQLLIRIALVYFGEVKCLKTANKLSPGAARAAGKLGCVLAAGLGATSLALGNLTITAGSIAGTAGGVIAGGVALASW